MVDGILLLDKPEGKSTSFCVRKIAKVAKTKGGHAGTLDPMATGLVTVLLGRATKLSQFVTDFDKTYTGEIAFGVTTSTGDREGEVLREMPVEIDSMRLREIARSIEGELTLPVPAYSAVKVGGRRLLDYARAGKSIEAPLRTIRVNSFSIKKIDLPCLEFETSVSKGTYIRSIAEHIGALAGCGAHLSKLRRTAVGGSVVEDAVPFAEALELAESGGLSRRMIDTAEFLRERFPVVEVDFQTASEIAGGRFPLIDIDKVVFGDIFLVLHSANCIAFLKKISDAERCFEFVRVLIRPEEIEN